MREYPMKGGLEQDCLDKTEKRHIQIRIGTRHEAKKKYARRVRKLAKIASKRLPSE